MDDIINPKNDYTCLKRWKSAGKVFFFARSPEAPRTIMERHPLSSTESMSLSFVIGAFFSSVKSLRESLDDISTNRLWN